MTYMPKISVQQPIKEEHIRLTDAEKNGKVKAILKNFFSGPDLLPKIYPTPLNRREFAQRSGIAPFYAAVAFMTVIGYHCFVPSSWDRMGSAQPQAANPQGGLETVDYYAESNRKILDEMHYAESNRKILDEMHAKSESDWRKFKAESDQKMLQFMIERHIERHGPLKSHLPPPQPMMYITPPSKK